MAKILVVDDAQFVRVRYRKLLGGEGHEVVEAGDGQEALQMYEKEDPDLVLMDITMPVMDGIEALEKLRERDSEARIVMSSAMGQERMVIKAIQSGARDFIVKPFEPETILEAVDKHTG